MAGLQLRDAVQNLAKLPQCLLELLERLHPEDRELVGNLGVPENETPEGPEHVLTPGLRGRPNVRVVADDAEGEGKAAPWNPGCIRPQIG
jgi:hypothetical protein